MGWVYYKLGKPVDAGNNLLIDEIHDPKKLVPLRTLAAEKEKMGLPSSSKA